MIDETQALTKKELCYRYRVSARYVEGEVKDGRLRMCRLSKRKVLFLVDDILAWLNKDSTVEAAK
jgi:hypothetical protein